MTGETIDHRSDVYSLGVLLFFISKYEMTQGQWRRFTDENPSALGPDSRYVDKQQLSLLHPVEQVSWEMCEEILEKRLGLRLPTEAQWEYAARGGTGTAWWTGSDRESLRGEANIADQAAARAGAKFGDISDWPDLDDGYAVHAPAGAYPANPFGLHEVAGNVWEWCRDWYADYGADVREGDGESKVSSSPTAGRVNRGGGFPNAAHLARSARRGEYPPSIRLPDLARAHPLEALLVEGLESGEPIVVTEEYWEKKRKDLAARRGKKKT